MTDSLKTAAEDFLHLINRLRRLGPETPPPKKAQITPSQLTFLEHAASSPGLGTQAMAEDLGLATPTVSIGVRQLEETGFLTRQPDLRDGRAVQIFLTAKGQKLLQSSNNFRRQKFERLLFGLTSDERNTFLDLLERAINSAEKEIGDLK
jgi:DNA-binding MarR family transcriptional regulator